MNPFASSVLAPLCCLAAIGCSSLARAQAITEGRESDADERGRLTVSFEQRSRYESLEPQFRPFLGKDDQALSLRTSVRLEAELSKWQFLGEIADSRAKLNNRESVLDGTIINSFEPVQLSISRIWKDRFGKGSLSSIQLGRLTLDLGSRRFMARNRFRNTLNSFVGANWSWADAEGRTLKAFYLQPISIRPIGREDLLSNTQEIDTVAYDTRILGIYYGQPVEKLRSHIEFYWLDLRAAEPSDRRDLTTIGGRALRSASPGHWHYELELVRQTGLSSAAIGASLDHDLKHDAYFGHIDIGYNFDHRLSPAISLLYDEASGDKNPGDTRNERFDTLYGARRFDFGPTGIYGPFARSNLKTPGFRFRLVPAASWQVALTYRVYKLASARDAWTTTELRDETGRSGDALGEQIELRSAWRPELPWLRIEFGAAYFRKGEFIRRNATELADASRYFYVATTISLDSASVGARLRR